MRTLTRRVVNEASLVGPVRCSRTGFDGRSREALVDDALLDHDFARAEVGVGLRLPSLHDVRARVREQKHLVADALLRVHHDGQRLVVDDDELGRIRGLVPVFGNHGDDGLTHVAHGPERDERSAHRLGEARYDVRREAELRDVVAREDRDDSRRCLRRVHVDRR